ncbi:MAG: metallophosphoesterase family protein [Chitinispirillaceae bacterium]|jgi:diadenosine tetraphosphatase ApaH/serine/threonine PP2A family protein phosphatase
MRRAFVSDIHANLEALEAVLEDIGKQAVDEIICLGDIVGYGAEPNECTEIIRKRSAIVLLGNHDAASVKLLDTNLFNNFAQAAIDWTVQILQKAHCTYLLSLPLTATREPFTFVHATPYEPGRWYYITSLEEASFNFRHFGTEVCLVGHTHIPMIVVLDEGKKVYARQAGHINLRETPGARFLINVGSVGQPRDRIAKSCYGIFDDATGEFFFRRVAYDIPKTQTRMRKANLPEFLITRLTDGI